MASRGFSFSTPEYLPDVDSYWNDTSNYLWDSPHPDEQYSGPGDDNVAQDNIGPSAARRTSAAQNNVARQQATSDNKTLSQQLQVPHANNSAPSTASEDSSHSSSSGPSAHHGRKASFTSSPTILTGANNRSAVDIPAGAVKMEDVYEEDDDDTFQLDDSTFPSVGMGMDNLSLNTGTSAAASPTFKYETTAVSPDTLGAGLFSDRNEGYSPRNFSAMRTFHSTNASPQMTVQPSKMFYVGASRENSPMINSNEESPAAFFNGNSPLSTTSDAFGNTLTSNSSLGGLMFESNNFDVSRIPSAKSVNGPSNSKPSTLKWPCKLTVDPIPDKSRVETQIPIKLTLHNVPAGIHRLHLPAHTISKPKFQAKPPFRMSADALELSTMLVCASAMQKEGLEEIAFQRATSDDAFGLIEDSKPGSNPVDENDPMKPLNGGPVAICQGCIVRERKRAARKKTKKADEEEEWAKDEAKRVIVFNCAEVRDWCVPGTKETAVRDHETPVDTMFVNAPMRIACYCRHQSEKVGFQVIFTIKTMEGKILAQAMSDSIMITDDHKQPSATTSIGLPFPGAQIPGAGLFSPSNFTMYPTFSQEMPFRSSWSTNDLRSLNQYAPQRRPANFQRQNSGGYSSQVSTATVTPRNLSRPASPTSPSGHSTKKRKSAGPPHAKIPTGLTMTRLEDLSPTTAASLTAAGPLSAGVNATPFNFTPPAGNVFGPPLDQQFGPTPVATPNPYQSGPSTPMAGNIPTGGFAPSGLDDRYQFYSAPTSQHPSRAPSRAPSPNSAARNNAYQSMQIPQQAAFALSSLPAGLNLQRPPIIQRLIPNTGPRSGGEEVTVLGSGFFQGLEVMFGDQTATNTIYWGDTTLVCHAPPSAQPGTVAVVFRHQHHTTPQELQQLQGLLPTRVVPYHYTEEAMQNMSAGMPSQQQQQQQQQAQSFSLNQMNSEDLARAFAATQAGFANYQRNPAG